MLYTMMMMMMMDTQMAICKMACSADNISNKTWNKVKMGFHGCALAHHLLTFVAIEIVTDFEAMSKTTMADLIDFKWLFFTGWNFFIQAIFLIIALYCDYVQMEIYNGKKVNKSEEDVKRMGSLRDFFFTTFVFPFSVFVFCLFWTTFYIDRELVMPTEWDAVIPIYINHGVHTNILPVVILETIIETKKAPESHVKRLVCISSFVLFYFACFLGAYFLFDRWIYVLFNHITWPQRILLLSLIYLGIHFIYFVGWISNGLVKYCGRLNVTKND